MPKTNRNVETTAKPFWKRWWFWVIVVLVIAAIGGATGAGGGTDARTGQTQSASTATDTQQQQPAEPQQEQADGETIPNDGDVTSGGIGYGEAVIACDNAAREQLFPGSNYESSPLLGQQKGQVGLEPTQYLATYNVTVDGRHTAITCLVDGTKDNINVISVNETEAQ